ncbi:MAG TPA: phosphohydrolase [Clostridiales bacterium]|nr:phosphohydrolase [Clostridiales bacterium]
MGTYTTLNKQIAEKIADDRIAKRENPYAFKDENAIRRVKNEHDHATVLRSNFIRDADKIINCPYFARYQDKTQVFSLYKNDDLTRRGLHVQLVSRISRTIGKALNLNCELIEAIALGHDIGHTPFGHAGESVLDEIYFAFAKRHFFHNIHSVRVLDKIYNYNLTLQTLDGIACHNGEREMSLYEPSALSGFADFDEMIEKCYESADFAKTIMPATLEGCVVRISDIIAYLGKDRGDANLTNTASESEFSDVIIGKFNAEIINNVTVNLVEQSYGKPYIKLSDEYFEAIKTAKKENYEKIYRTEKARGETEQNLKPMMKKLYEKLLSDLISGDRNSLIFKHHIDYVRSAHCNKNNPYEQTEPNLIVTDYIASMTDDYFIDLYAELFPKSRYRLTFKGYFD